jgi:glycosyltransferase involved in cell wall biosynthesis
LWLLKWLDLLYSLRALWALPRADILITNTFWIPILAGWLRPDAGLILVDVQRMPKGQMRLYGRASRLRANSTAVAQAIVREAPELSARIRTVPNPLPFLPPAEPPKKKAQRMLYCGRLHPEKGIGLLIQGFSEAVRAGLRGWTLRLVGPAEVSAGGGGQVWLEDLLAVPKAAGLPIEWMGPEYGELGLRRHYEEASIFVYPSLAEQGETFGLAPLEAMAFGAVPIVSALACFRDFISPGENGLVFDHRRQDAAALLAEQMLFLAARPERLEAMAREARRVRETHHPSVITDAFVACFQDMLVQPFPPVGMPPA